MQKLPDEAFTQNCATLYSDTTSLQTSCSGQCLTYIFENPDADLSSADRKMFVRGCLRKLTNVDASSEVFAGNRSTICEYDKDFRRLNSLGQVTTTKALVERCTGQLCNNKTDFDPNCADQSSDSSQNSELQCYSCNADNGNCNHVSSICVKKYCYKGVINIHGKQSVYKTCANFNPYGSSAVCSYSPGTIVPGNIADVHMSVGQCFCNDKQYCNSAVTFYSGIVPTIISFGVAAVMPFFT
uniref:DUF753 domain-containing protein n=1 Tax=Syphacia muris TaxID=451379 RepID=A0A0N5AX38_9BILA